MNIIMIEKCLKKDEFKERAEKAKQFLERRGHKVDLSYSLSNGRVYDLKNYDLAICNPQHDDAKRMIREAYNRKDFRVVGCPGKDDYNRKQIVNSKQIMLLFNKNFYDLRRLARVVESEWKPEVSERFIYH